MIRLVTMVARLFGRFHVWRHPHSILFLGVAIMQFHFWALPPCNFVLGIAIVRLFVIFGYRGEKHHPSPSTVWVVPAAS
jgi:hypothetical protein